LTINKERLVKAGLSFYHAMNLGGFAEYVRTQAVICREDLLQQDHNATPFRSDPSDQARGLLTRVFGNPNDFGAFFSRAHNPATPNIYGPIQIVFPPSTWLSLDDLVLTNRSVMRLGDNWRSNSITGQEFNRFIDTCVDGVPQSPYAYVEASTRNRKLALNLCTLIIVEPIVINSFRLVDVVRNHTETAGLKVPVVEREYTVNENIPHIQELVGALLNATTNVPHGKLIVFNKVPEWMSNAPPAIVGRWEQWATNFYLDTVIYTRRHADWHRSVCIAEIEVGTHDEFDEANAFRRLMNDAELLRDPTVDELVSLFKEHFMDPANGVPYNGREGGYLYVFGGPYDPSDVFRDVLDGVDEELIEEAAQEIYGEGGCDWVFRSQY